MTILDTIKDERLSISFEIFPPKQDQADSVLRAAESIAALGCAYISVTWGAGGSGEKSIGLIRSLRNIDREKILAHLTCAGTSRADMGKSLACFRDMGILNIMALRGDLPEGTDPAAPGDFPHAADLIQAVKAAGPFCVGAACYPEVHPESASQAEDIRHLREKVDAGADFLTTQMFFDNNVLYAFLYKLREAGVTVPVVPGIMPITSSALIRRALMLSGCIMPRRFLSLVDRFGETKEAMTQAGILYAADQIIDLFANGIRHVHVYTMNKPEVARAITGHLSEILGRTF